MVRRNPSSIRYSFAEKLLGELLGGFWVMVGSEHPALCAEEVRRVTESDDLTIAAARHALGLLPSDHNLPTGLHGTPFPDMEQAAWVLLELHIGAIAHGRIDPEEGMRLVVEEVFRPACLARVSHRRPGDSHDIDRLLALQDTYDDIRRSEERNGTPDRRRGQIDAQVTLSAKEWMLMHASGRVY